ncbi:uncharacterized protein TRIADDRAFT_19973, partial [Trichoplax adhaerens]
DHSISGNRIVIGVCSMNRKSRARPMKEILNRLRKYDSLQIITFQDDVILNEPVEKWPCCDCLIAFYSSGFPLKKAIEYAQLRKPFLLNDLTMQYDLMDRAKVYRILKKHEIPIPRYTILERNLDNENDGQNIDELEDILKVSGEIFHKPFVEKPVSAEDHNIVIYYPSSAGGGSQRLFRKIGSKSSVYKQESHVRRDGSYLYEEFMPTEGVDVKIYTVGPEYAHAEARKSPALDGVVERDIQGKEVRYPIILTAAEKTIARKVCLAFKQTVCGFDLLRANGKSYVCDVNGFSFVKTSQKYYNDCAQILGHMILSHFSPQQPIPLVISRKADDVPLSIKVKNGLELRCVIAIMRHGDRTPKQKLKMHVNHEKFIEIFRKYGGSERKNLKLKKPKQLQEILDIVRELLFTFDSNQDKTIFESYEKLQQLRAVLEMYGHFSGINRKVQLKCMNKRIRADGNSNSSDDNRASRPSLLLIAKWGGELTPLGRSEAERLGCAFRCIYPSGQGEYSNYPGSGFLRLHSTYRHDLKIYSSDEGRVQTTAASFAKGLLDLECGLTPILVHLVKSNHTNRMLDTSTHAESLMMEVKSRLHEILQKDENFTEEDYAYLSSVKSNSIIAAMKMIGNPRRACQKVFELVRSLTKQLKGLIEISENQTEEPLLYMGESLVMMYKRWTKLEKEFKRNDLFEISKIPDIYDCIKYDALHNRDLRLDNIHDLYKAVKPLADIVIPLEYGITGEEKHEISEKICHNLFRKLRADLQHNICCDTESSNRLNPKYSQGVITPDRHVRTRLYFTSESHIHTLLSAIRDSKLCDASDKQWTKSMECMEDISELNYLTQIVFMLYEDPSQDVSSEQKYRVTLHFSAGDRLLEEQLGEKSIYRKVSENSNFNDKTSVKEAPSKKDGTDAPIESSTDDNSGKKFIFTLNTVQYVLYAAK